MQSTPLISVIIPYYEGEKFIVETINSIFRQNYESLEIILVSDGSSEKSLEVLEPFKGRITILSQENKGQAAARNFGIKHSKGQVLGLIDQDDLWPENHISVLLPYIFSNQEYDFAQGRTETFRGGGGNPYEVLEVQFHPELIGSALYKREVFNVVGLFDEGMREGEDFDWNIRLRESNCKEKRVDEVTLLFRRHETNQTLDAGVIKRGQLISLSKKIARKKAEAEKTYEL